MSLPIIIGPRATRMSRAFPTVLGGYHPVPVGDDHRFGPESHVFGLLNEQGGVGGSGRKKLRSGTPSPRATPVSPLVMRGGGSPGPFSRDAALDSRPSCSGRFLQGLDQRR